MSVALRPVFEDHHEHGLVDEGAVLLDVIEELDGIAAAAGRTPLSDFDASAEVPEKVVVERAMAAEGAPDLSDYPAAWPDPADAVATLASLEASVEALREVLREAAEHGTRFHLTIA